LYVKGRAFIVGQGIPMVDLSSLLVLMTYRHSLGQYLKAEEQ